MIVAGCDFGTLAVKVAVIQDESVVSSEISQIRALPEQVATDAVGRALSKIGLSTR